MRFSRALLIGAVLAAALCIADPTFADSLPRGGDITCQGPFSGGDTGEALLARYKPQARIMEVSDITGESGDGLVLNPDDPDARIEIDDDHGNGTGHLTFLNIKSPTSLWSVEGLKLGMTLQDLTRANGGPVTLSGFWQESETTFAVSGRLRRGDCEVVVVFFAPQRVDFDGPLYGRKKIASNDPRLLGLNLSIDQLGLKLPEPND